MRTAKNSLYTFTGNLIKQTLPLSPNQVLLWGCGLRNTEFIFGAAIVTGHETKEFMVARLTLFTLVTLYSTIIHYMCQLR